jgi:hypothetical protein
MQVEELHPVAFKIAPNSGPEVFKANIQANIGLPVPRLRVRQCMIVGGGPSVADYLGEIATAKANGFDIFAINGAVNFLMKNNIVPQYGILYDAREGNTVFVRRTYGAVHWLVASHAHPAVWDALLNTAHGIPERTTMFHTNGGDGIQEMIRAAEPEATIFESASMGGLMALSLVNIMGYKTARLYGYDSSAREVPLEKRTDPTDIYAKHAYPQPLNEDQKLVEVYFNGTPYTTTGVLAQQATYFSRIYRLYEQLGLSITVIGDGLLPDMWRAEQALRSITSQESQ